MQTRAPPSSTLFPYTTLFRSLEADPSHRDLGRLERAFRNQVFELGRRIRTAAQHLDRKSTRLNSSHVRISYAVFCLKKKNIPCTIRCTNTSSPSDSLSNRDCA